MSGGRGDTPATSAAGERQGRLSRRDLLKYLGAAGVALASARFFTSRALASPAAVSLLQDSPVLADVTMFLTDFGGQLKGTTIKVVTENTPLTVLA